MLTLLVGITLFLTIIACQEAMLREIKRAKYTSVEPNSVVITEGNGTQYKLVGNRWVRL